MRRLAREDRPLCGSNLGSGAQNLRLRQAVITLALTLGLTIFLVEADVARTWRLLLFFPFMFAAVGAIQGLYRTCPMHVNKRTRVCESGEVEPVVSQEEIRRSRRLAFRVLTASLVSAVSATALVFFLP